MCKFLKQYFMPEYVSTLDQCLQDYNKTHPQLSKSQRKEKEKFDRIYYLRDYEQQSEQ